VRADGPGGVQTLDRAISVVDAVAAGGRVGLAELVEATGLARASAHRLAVALERQGLLARDDDGRFRLGTRLVAWGAAAARDFALAELAGPVLERLVADTGESAQLYVRDGDHRVCVATRERNSGLRDTVPLGAVLPLTAGSGAKVLLAWATDAARFAISSPVLAAVRAKGWAESAAEREAGVASVSAPVRDHRGDVVAAISVSGPIDRLGRHPGKRLSAAVVAAAASLSAGAAV
jgi:DNA-binding IclR family transcriptional regulator